MRRFECRRCGREIDFSVQSCPACGADLGYVPEARSIAVLTPTAEPSTYVTATGEPVWRCLNAAWGCNWMLPAHQGLVWCRSCQLTRGRPDDARSDALQAWTIAEAAKRRLVHQLDVLELPIEPRTTDDPDGLAFDFVALPGARGVTGHLDGLVTLDLAEIDDRYRDDQRRQLGERFRSIIGHLRHEVGHYYFTRLVGTDEALEEFRQLFGDERVDYRDAVAGHYTGEREVWDTERFISPYAASHPFEDWAETFADYLHIVDATDTAVAHHLIADDGVTGTIVGPAATLDFAAVIAAWRPMNIGVNAVAESVGAPAVFPLDPSEGVIGKLAFVHERVASARRVGDPTTNGKVL